MTKKSRTDKRSKSGAQTECPICKKMLRGAKGVKMHMDERHADQRANAQAGAK